MNSPSAPEQPDLPWLSDRLSVLGTLEQKVMNAIWDLDQVAFPDLCDALGPSHSAATVTTVLKRLMDKGLLTRTGSRRRYRYQAAVSRAQFQQAVARRMSTSLMDQMGSRAVTHFVDAAAELDPALLDELDRLIEARRRRHEQPD